MKKGANNSYFGNVWEGISSLVKGLGLTFKHFLNARRHRRPVGVESNDYFEQKDGIVTLEFPHESIPVPDNGRYRLHNEIEDCIVCDLCAKICPVNCIEIDAIKATEEIGKTSDGSTRRLYAGTFNIDMAKCCYCGLCTTVCPTECLTMTKTYDYSEYDIHNMIYHFSDLTPEQAAEKKKLWEDQQKEKELLKAKAAAEKAAAAASAKDSTTDSGAQEKPPVAPEVKKAAFKPVFKPVIPKKNPGQENDKKE